MAARNAPGEVSPAQPLYQLDPQRKKLTPETKQKLLAELYQIREELNKLKGTNPNGPRSQT